MQTESYIISGFLGAGKTTFIRELLGREFKGQKVALIENDFGEISVDASLLQDTGVEIKEINAGCICCSLTGDFLASLKELLKDYKPEVLLIEPSGVGKLSDIERVLKDQSLKESLNLKSKITIVDVKRAPMYLDNFGEFFEDQVHHANVILLSRVEENQELLEEALEAINECDPQGNIIKKDWEDIQLEDLRGDSYHHHHEGCSCGCQHHHGAEEVFDTYTFYGEKTLSMKQLEGFLQKLPRLPGELLRMKGVLLTEEGAKEIQYLPDEVKVRPTENKEQVLVFIGRGPKEEAIKRAIEEL